MISGVSLWKILKPILFASMLLSLSVLYVNEKLVPRYTPISYEIRNDKIRHIGKKAKTVLKDIAIFGENNRIIYAGSFDIQKKILKDIIIHENDKNQNLVMKLTAQKGWWEKGRWVFENGTSYRLNESGHMIGTPSPFRRKIMDLKERPRDFKKKGKNPEYMNFHELRSYINRFSKKSSSTTKKLTVDLWYKTSLPFVSIIVIFVAAPFAFALKKGGLLIGIGISIVIGLLFYGISAIFVAMGKAGILPPILAAWMGNLLFLTIGLFSMKKCR